MNIKLTVSDIVLIIFLLTMIFGFGMEKDSLIGIGMIGLFMTCFLKAAVKGMESL